MIFKAILLLCIAGFVAAYSHLDCNFENGFCKYINDPNNWKINWEILSLDFIGFTEHNLVENKGLCMKADGTDNEETDQKLTARLWSRVMSRKSNIGCVSFQYRLLDDKDHKLTLMRREIGSCQQKDKSSVKQSLICDSDKIWNSNNENANSPSSWVTQMIDLPKSNDFKLILEGTIPSGNPNAKICVDNITSSAEPCQIPSTDEVKAAQSYQSWVELFGMTFAGALALGLTIPIAVFVVCLFERKRRRGKKNKRIIRHADELEFPEGMNTASGEDTYPIPQKYANSQVGIGHPRLMNRANSTPAGANGQGGNYTMGKRNGTPQQALGPRSNSGQISHTMGRSGLESGWMMSSQHGDLMENDEYTIDSDYTTHRQMSVPASGYVPASSQVDTGLMQGQVSSMNAMQQLGNQSVMYQNRQVPQPQTNVVVATTASNNPFGSPANIGMSGAGQDNRSLAGSHVVNFTADENRATPGLPFYPPRYEEAMGFNHGQPVVMEEKPPLLPPRVPESSGSGAGTSCSTPLPPAPPPLPLSGHPSAGRFNVGGHNVLPGNEQ